MKNPVVFEIEAREENQQWYGFQYEWASTTI
jgi:hypothetical protein